MSFELKKLNVHKVVETEKEKDNLTSQGFVEVKPEEAGVPKTYEAPNEAKPAKESKA